MRTQVAVITLHNVLNYGSVLQTFATQEKLKEFGCDVTVVDFQRENTIYPNVLETYLKKDSGIKKLIKKFILIPSILQAKKVMSQFINRNICLTEHSYYNHSDFSQFPIEADIYCTGSDQVWNNIWNEHFYSEYYLDFAEKGKRKIAYSASLGVNELTHTEEKIIQSLLRDYYMISVREQTGNRIISKMGIKAQTVLDPTLVMTRQFWESKAVVIEKKGYILVYQLNHNKEFDKYVKRLSELKKMPVIRICRRYDQLIQNGHCVVLPRVEEFVSYFLNAGLVVTDSFHGTAFSINLNVDFVSILPPSFESRITDILELVGLKSRLLKSWDDYEIAEEKIDFEKANQILEKEREKVNTFLQRALMQDDILGGKV